jgi:hypothetical protein
MSEKMCFNTIFNNKKMKERNDECNQRYQPYQ